MSESLSKKTIYNKSWIKYWGALLPIISTVIFLYIFKNPILALIFYHLGMAVTIFSFNRHLRYKIKNGWDPFLGLVMIVMVLFIFFLVFLLWDDFLVNINLKSKLSLYNLNNPTVFTIFSILFILINPLLEEIFWRDLLNSGKLIAIEDIGFTLYHGFVLILFFPLDLIFLIMCCLFIASVGWRLIAKKLNGLAVPVLMHFIADCCIIWITFTKILH